MIRIPIKQPVSMESKKDFFFVALKIASIFSWKLWDLPLHCVDFDGRVFRRSQTWYSMCLHHQTQSGVKITCPNLPALLGVIWHDTPQNQASQIGLCVYFSQLLADIEVEDEI